MKTRYILLAGLILSLLAACSTAPIPTLTATSTDLPTNAPAPTAAPTKKLATPTPTPIPPTPTATQDPCLRADQVTVEMAGQTVCVRGIVSKYTEIIHSRTWIGTRLDLGESGFYLYSTFQFVDENNIVVREGKCLVYNGVVKVQGKNPYIEWGKGPAHRRNDNVWVGDAPDIMPDSYCQ